MNLFHFNRCSLPKKFVEKQKLNFDVIGTSKSRIMKNEFLINGINLEKYFYESCPTGFLAGGPVIYINNHLSYKAKSDLCI